MKCLQLYYTLYVYFIHNLYFYWIHDDSIHCSCIIEKNCVLLSQFTVKLHEINNLYVEIWEHWKGFPFLIKKGIGSKGWWIDVQPLYNTRDSLLAYDFRHCSMMVSCKFTLDPVILWQLLRMMGIDTFQTSFFWAYKFGNLIDDIQSSEWT